MSHVPAADGAGAGAGQKRPNGGRERACVFRVLRVSGTMRKAEEEAIRRARREIVRVRGVEESGVLGDLVSGSGSVEVDGKADREGVGRGRVPVMENVMDESEDEGMLVDDDDDDD